MRSRGPCACAAPPNRGYRLLDRVIAGSARVHRVPAGADMKNNPPRTVAEKAYEVIFNCRQQLE